MLRIAVFDDDERDAKVTYDILWDYLQKENKKAEIYIFTDKEEVMNYIRENPVDVVFLDILVDEKAAGIEMAKQINEWSYRTQIVFLSGYLNYATDIFDTRHIYYVLKTELRDRLPGVIAKIEKVMASEQWGLFYLKKNGNDLILEKGNISYIERDRRVSKIYCNGQTYSVGYKLSELEEMLAHPDFVRCHNSYIVNLQHVAMMERKSISLKDGTMVPISRARNEEVQSRFLEWLQKYV